MNFSIEVLYEVLLLPTQHYIWGFSNTLNKKHCKKTYTENIWVFYYTFAISIKLTYAFILNLEEQFLSKFLPAAKRYGITSAVPCSFEIIISAHTGET